MKSNRGYNVSLCVAIACVVVLSAVAYGVVDGEHPATDRFGPIEVTIHDPAITAGVGPIRRHGEKSASGTGLPPYSIIDLGVLPGALTSYAFGMNDAGQVVGVSGENASFGHAFLFTDENANGVSDPTEMVDLGSLGGPYSFAYGVNNLGQVVGLATNDVLVNENGWPRYEGRPFLFQNGTMTNLGAHPGYEWLTLAYSINELGQIIGRAGATYSSGVALIWDQQTAGATELPGATRTGGGAFDINNPGLVTGAVRSDLGVVATVWREVNGDWETLELGTPVPPDHPSTVYSAGMAINDSGQVVGWSWAEDPDQPAWLVNHGFVVTPQDGVWYRDDDGNGINDLLVDLLTLGGTSSGAFDINNLGHIVGWAHTTPGASDMHAFLRVDGVMYDLNDFIDPDSGWVLERARSINDTGQIAGTGVNSMGQVRAFLLTPAPGDCNFNGIPDEEDIATGTSVDCNGNGMPDECEPDCNANGIADECDVSTGTSSDCNGNGVPDDCEPDCNGNGVGDGCDISNGTSEDCTTNGVPDECEPDCNFNGVADSCDIANGTTPDCNQNMVPDSCDVLNGAVDDCNDNGIPDSCDLPPLGVSPDCNENNIPDECDITGGASDDCDKNAIPDECDFVDCNSNGALDICDLADATSHDNNGNGIPDECDDRGFSLVPVGASGPHTINGNTISLFRAGQRVTFEIRISGWNLGRLTPPFLSLYQAQIDSSGFTSAERGSLSLPSIDIPCMSDNECPGYGASCEPTGLCDANGAFYINESRPDYVFADLTTIAGFDTSQPDMRLAAVLWPGEPAVPDTDEEYYAGTMILDVSQDALGIFEVGFVPGDDYTFMGDEESLGITPPSLNSARIVAPPDCNGNLTPDYQDLANGTSEDCNENEIPDECDLADGTSGDCNENKLPDECEDCNGNSVADECDIENGTSVDEDGNSVPDACETMPTVSPAGGRYFEVTPRPGNAPCAIVVSCPLGTNRYLSAPDGITGVARVVTDYDDAAFLTPSEWGGSVMAFGTAIRTDTVYEVRIDYRNFVSLPTSLKTHKWGDGVGVYYMGAWTPPNGTVDMLDIAATVDAFTHSPTAPPIWRVDLRPAQPDGQIDFTDIAACVDAFMGAPDPDGDPCP